MTDAPDHDLVPPNAGSLIEALRSLGYSTPAAIADILDNALSAGATHIHVSMIWAGKLSRVLIVDSGRGMSTGELREAMRTGGRSPSSERAPGDLGRFGLGLKTASFSQCRRVSVASRAAGYPTAVRRWDLDHVQHTGEWQLLHGLDPDSPGGMLPESWLSGTAVLWEVMDRVVAGERADDRSAHRRFLQLTDNVRDHLAMVFGRFITCHGVHITLNGNAIRAWDPFLCEDPGTQTLPTENLSDHGEKIRLQGHVLPHPSRMEAGEVERAMGPLGWSEQQGFYVYRGDRLLVAGGWLGLGYRCDEAHRLARISVDISTASDARWDIDVRKSRARPPGTLRDGLRHYADRVRARALEVHHQRARTTRRHPTAEVLPLWQTDTGGGQVRQHIVRDHPLVCAVAAGSRDPARGLESLLRMLEATVPVERIWVENPVAGSPPEMMRVHSEVALLELMTGVLYILCAGGQSREDALGIMERMDLFREHSTLLAGLPVQTTEELSNAR